MFILFKARLGYEYPGVMSKYGKECRSLFNQNNLGVPQWEKFLKMATLYGSGKGFVRIFAGIQILLGLLMFVFGIVGAVILCHWTSKAGLGIWIGLVVLVTAAIGLRSCSVDGQSMINWYSFLSIFCVFLAILLAISYGTAMSDFYDELTSDESAVDDFYSRQYVAVFMRTSYYSNCISDERRDKIEKERTGIRYIIQIEQVEQRKLLSEMEKHGRKGLGVAAVFIFLSVFEFICACIGVMYACTAAGWCVKKATNVPARSNVTVHHSRAGGTMLR